ncbi:MAG: hypothetical protein ACK5KR_06635 [Breznakia sp.]
MKYKNKYYIPVNNCHTKPLFRPKTKCMIIEAFDQNTYMSVDDKVYGLVEVAMHEKFSKELENEPIVEQTKRKYIPPMTHLWKSDSFAQFQAKQKHLQNGANV